MSHQLPYTYSVCQTHFSVTLRDIVLLALHSCKSICCASHCRCYVIELHSLRLFDCRRTERERCKGNVPIRILQMSGKQFFIKKKLLPTEVKLHLILNGHAWTRYLTTGLNVANWAPRGKVTWASRSSGPMFVQKGLPGISFTTDGRGRPKFGSRCSPNYWANTYPHKMAAQQWAPGMDGLGHPLLGNQICPAWMLTSAQSGHPPLPNFGVHACLTWKPISIHVGHPTLSTLEVHFCPYWTPTPTHVGLPTLSTMEAHACPRWMSMLVHTGRPNPPKFGSPTLPMPGVHVRPRRKSMLAHVGLPPPSTTDAQSPPKLEAHLHPRRVSNSAQVGSPILVRGCPKAAKIWKPIHDAWTPGIRRSWTANPCTRAPTRKWWMPKKDSETHPELWKPTFSGGHVTST